jgi:hypothetical protein
MTKIKQVSGLQAELDNTIKKGTGVTEGYIPEWKGTSGTALDPGYLVVTEIEEGNKTGKKLASVQAIKDYIDLMITANSALTFQGVLNLTSTAGQNEVPEGEPGHLYIIGTPGKLGTSGSFVELETGWWLICKETSTGGGWGDNSSKWEIIEMDYSTGLQKLLTGVVKNGLGPAVAASQNTTHMVASISALDPAPFAGVVPVCTVGGISLDFATGEVNLSTRPFSPGVFWFAQASGSLRLHVRLPFVLDNEDWIELKYSTI